MMREANEFKAKYTHAVIMMVPGDEMRPFYKPCEYVDGKMRFGEEIARVANKDFIVHLKNGYRHFRRLIKNAQGRYDLT